jgi:hypothetical protein
MGTVNGILSLRRVHIATNSEAEERETYDSNLSVYLEPERKTLRS